MPLITFVVPCFNSQDYMAHCIDTLLTAKEKAEILIIDDGSSDNTASIADEYERKNPSIIKSIHQPNKGHGGAVNTGIEHATGTYFKVVDSDDWLDPENLQKVLARLETLQQDDEMIPDMFITNFIYDKVSEVHKKTMKYTKILPREKIFTWKEARNMPLGKYILMHSVIYRTDVLRNYGLHLPEHTFYVDNLFVYEPLSNVHKMYYMNIDLYHYFIGREDQSVHESVMLKRVDQQLRVNTIMIDRLAKRQNQIDTHCYQYMYNYLCIITAISSVLLIMKNDVESKEKMDDLWNHINEVDPSLYKKMRKSILGVALHTNPTIVKFIYHMAQKVYGFN